MSYTDAIEHLKINALLGKIDHKKNYILKQFFHCPSFAYPIELLHYSITKPKQKYQFYE